MRDEWIINFNGLVIIDCMLLACMLLAIAWQRWHRDPGAPAAPWLALAFLLFGAHRVELIAGYLHGVERNSKWLALATGVVATIAACVLPRAMVGYLKQPGPAVLQVLNAALQDRVIRAEQTQAELMQHNRLLALRLSHLETLLETEGWTAEKAKLLAELRGSLGAMKEVLHGV